MSANVFFLVTELESFDTSSISKFLSHAYFCVIPSFFGKTEKGKSELEKMKTIT